ncbi:hypothetical protein [Dictyobacter kobayashii]|uniref:Protein kinase domain-containing protein n=1 Tax=Dictyobacter kobayashii TaxID=2014872 RepID=A0A402ANJ2_9CHLR|nr:hypothetical protein [Dictyobacter kobayashii]GCE20723.1 hypothetical protein KDK_45230 [Dictyobacter kobayashii]
MQLHIGQKVGNYRIVGEIAQGAYAYVYKATHSFLSQRMVALKILHTTFVDPGLSMISSLKRPISLSNCAIPIF